MKDKLINLFINDKLRKENMTINIYFKVPYFQIEYLCIQHFI